MARLRNLTGKLLGKAGTTIRGAVEGLKFDPETNEGFLQAARGIEQLIREEKEHFDWGSACDRVGAAKSERSSLAQLVYKRAVTRVWEDNHLAPNEQLFLQWLRERLSVPERAVDIIHRTEERRVLWHLMKDILADNKVTPEERAQLDDLSAVTGAPVSAMASLYFREEGAADVEELFDDVIRNRLGGAAGLDRAYSEVRGVATSLSLPESELHEIMRPHVDHLMEHILIDARTEGAVHDSMKEAIDWVIATFPIAPGTAAAIREQLDRITQLTDIMRGRLPVVPHDTLPIDLPARQTPHFAGRCTLTEQRPTSSGVKTDRYHGEFVLTHTHYHFVSDHDERNLSEPLAKVVRRQDHPSGFVLSRSTRKGTLGFRIHDDPELALQVFAMAIELAKGRLPQSLQDNAEFRPTRHIPRDVRQRVWVEYGGRCSNCGSTHYLEYDHIIPHAKGGSNDFGNIQLLCRACNLAKSDSI